MKKNLTTLLLACQMLIFSQIERYQPKNNLYFGVNFGLNLIDIHADESRKSIHAGAFAEYYFAKQWSLTGKISYFETGLDFYNQSYRLQSRGFGGGSSNFETQIFSADFSGHVLATSLQIKWEFNLIKNFSGYLKTGYGYYIETQSKYENYIGDKNEGKYPSSYGGWITGMGLTYFLNEEYALFLEIELHNGPVKFNGGNYVYGSGNQYASNNLIGLGIKYKFKTYKK
jgi:hypothetical protein